MCLLVVQIDTVKEVEVTADFCFVYMVVEGWLMRSRRDLVVMRTYCFVHLVQVIKLAELHEELYRTGYTIVVVVL